MDSESAERAALMSIHPEFATLIVAGRKRVEFRRRSLSQLVTRIVIYATSPICAVVAVAEVLQVRKAPPQKLWSIYRSVGGIDYERFAAYFAGSTQGVAYELGRVWALTSPVMLGDRGLPERPPQAYQYLEDATLAALMNGTRSPNRMARSA